MEHGASRPLMIVPMLLLSVVVTQIIYIVKATYQLDIPGTAIWSVEAVVFLGMTLLGLLAMVQNGQTTLGWAAIAIAGLLNVLQVGIGLAMFGPLADAGEAMAPVYDAVAAGAFFLYFTGKLLFGLSAIVFGLSLVRSAGTAKIVGGLAIVTGAAAMLVNLCGMTIGMTWLYQAGATGTVATLVLAMALMMVRRTA